jgi:hypothetical protein
MQTVEGVVTKPAEGLSLMVIVRIVSLEHPSRVTTPNLTG